MVIHKLNLFFEDRSALLDGSYGKGLIEMEHSNGEEFGIEWSTPMNGRKTRLTLTKDGQTVSVLGFDKDTFKKQFNVSKRVFNEKVTEYFRECESLEISSLLLDQESYLLYHRKMIRYSDSTTNGLGDGFIHAYQTKERGWYDWVWIKLADENAVQDTIMLAQVMAVFELKLSANSNQSDFLFYVKYAKQVDHRKISSSASDFVSHEYISTLYEWAGDSIGNYHTQIINHEAVVSQAFVVPSFKNKNNRYDRFSCIDRNFFDRSGWIESYLLSNSDTSENLNCCSIKSSNQIVNIREDEALGEEVLIENVFDPYQLKLDNIDEVDFNEEREAEFSGDNFVVEEFSI